MPIKKKSKRYYQGPWNVLKEFKIVSIVPTNSTNPEVVKKWVKTARKAMGKEKYLDSSFRVKYPDARITSSFDEATNKLTFELDLGIYLTKVAELFEN